MEKNNSYQIRRMIITQSEKNILAQIEKINKMSVLCGLGTSPTDANWNEKRHRFTHRLHKAGKIVWVSWTKTHGAGWALAEYANKFKETV